MNSFDEETFRTVYTLECVKDGNLVFSLVADSVIDLGDNFWGVYAASGDGCWYIAGSKTFAMISPDGKTEMTSELPEQANGLAADRNGTLHVWGMGYHMILSDGRLESSSEWLDAAGSRSCSSERDTISTRRTRTASNTATLPKTVSIPARS